MDFIIAFSNAEAQRRIRRLLESGGCRPAVCCTSGGEAIRAARNIENSIIICGFRLPDMTANELAADLRGRAAVLVVSSAANVDLCEGENLYKLATPAPRDRGRGPPLFTKAEHGHRAETNRDGANSHRFFHTLNRQILTIIDKCLITIVCTLFYIRSCSRQSCIFRIHNRRE